MTDLVNHPEHYGGADNPYEVIKVIEAWEQQNSNLDWNLLTAVKYLGRCGLKDPLLQDLQKAYWYLGRKIEQLKKQQLFGDVARRVDVTTLASRDKEYLPKDPEGCPECGAFFGLHAHKDSCPNCIESGRIARVSDAGTMFYMRSPGA